MVHLLLKSIWNRTEVVLNSFAASDHAVLAATGAPEDCVVMPPSACLVAALQPCSLAAI
jgi:hypothetical protein